MGFSAPKVSSPVMPPPPPAATPATMANSNVAAVGANTRARAAAAAAGNPTGSQGLSAPATGKATLLGQAGI